ncbi:MAG: NAD(P)H-hydrate epimerase [Planctomycetota bacterium]
MHRSTPQNSPEEILFPGLRPAPIGFPPPPQSPGTIREWDRRAIEEFGIPGIVLMECAGRAAAAILQAEFAEPFAVFSGPGQNGGDGFVVARCLSNAGLSVEAFVFEGVAYRPESDAGRNLEILRRAGLEPVALAAADVPGRVESAIRRGTVVDALFGTGLARPLGSPYRDLIEAWNRAGATVVSIDVPSGLDAETGEILGSAVRAVFTITFAAAKVGFFRARGPEVCGRVRVVDIGIPRALWGSR